jgi:repressor LexA
MTDLTKKQRAVLDVIRATVAEKGYPPTVREIGAKLGVKSPYAILRHLRELERKGYLKRSDGTRRTLTIVDKGESPDPTIPFKGRIS